ncbi:MAG: hypothetical protein HYU66_14220 [Armatimonadetes bacterium]|nr:hypothetical protein [Armatimonadota bacterium]
MTALLCCLLLAPADGWVVDQPRPGVYVLRDDTGAWGGGSLGVAHQNSPDYQVRKTLDLRAFPVGVLQRARAARLRLYFGIQDYSWNMGDHTANGLNESFEVVINGHAVTYETRDPRFPSKPGAAEPQRWGWVDLDFPTDWLGDGQVEVLIRKLPGGKNDDYIYPGIDNSVRYGHSAVTFDGGRTWRTDVLNAVPASGEYMLRLVLAEHGLAASATWRAPDTLDDPEGLVAWRGRDGADWRLEPRGDGYDKARPLKAVVTFTGPAPAVAWRDRDEKPLPATADAGGQTLTLTLPPGQYDVGALAVHPPAGGAVQTVTVDYEQPTTEPQPVVDLRPAIAAPRGKRRAAAPRATLASDRVTLDNGALRAAFRVRPRLRLESLHGAEIDRNIVARPDAARLFCVKLGDRVFGAAECPVRDVRTTATGFTARVAIGEAGLVGDFTARVEASELRLGLTLSNTGMETARFHVSFPHLAGLQLSDRAEDDYYLFPWGGGVIAGAPARLRTAYGEESAWWQFIDLFSPGRGGGVYLRADDPTGLYKVPHLRKGLVIPAESSLDETGGGYMAADMQWRDALTPDPGIGVTFDYLRRDRETGGSFTVPSVCLGSHAGDWREAMKVYVAWSNRTWPPRPYPSKLTPCWNLAAPGWGQSPLYKNGGYDTSYLSPRYDVAELMSWWTWSELGPWRTPLEPEMLIAALGEGFYKQYTPYMVKEPVSGKIMYPLNRGDYDGYMPLWGGLPALRAQLDRIRAAGQLPMFYTDPILGDANTKLATEHGAEYGIMNPLCQDDVHIPATPKGYVGSYGGYCMCLDTEWYSGWVAETMGRVCRETGVDGIRLDEYGHRGYVCTSDKHQHLFAEPGHNAWLQALARNVRQVHAAMDKVRPGLVLTTEFPGTDQMAAALEGAITYDVRNQAPFRPVPINLFRFYFPACRVMELEIPGRRNGRDMMLWNAEMAFETNYPANLHQMLKENADALDALHPEPLVPTLVPRVYANRFAGGGKVVTTLFNGTGHTVDGQLLAVTPAAGRHFVDLASGQELAPAKMGGRWAVAARLAREHTLVVADLPRRLRVAAGAASVTGPAAGLAVAVVDGEAKVLVTSTPGARLPALPEGSKPATVKLLRAGRLVDVAAW